MKTIAMYLPQFHRIEENDRWWGEGYTEWVAVKKAKRIVEGQYQPRIPLEDNYYNLMDKDVIIWQANLMKEYGIDGVCFYHYWFKNGRKVLEKPAENLLLWKDIEMPFCFSWANESWVRTWSNIRGNVWNDEEETDCNNSVNGVLLDQDYGEQNEWKKHFMYLLPFFKDKRYIRIEDKPIFLIYKPNEIPVLTQMMDYWNKLAEENGLCGLFFIGTNTNKAVFDVNMRVEPQSSDMNKNQIVVEYEESIFTILKNAYTSPDNTLFCGFPGYDDSPRRGNNGKVYLNSTPEGFYTMMKYLYYLSDFRGNELLFINAWNEWGEGMYLEPDQQYGFGYLEANRNARRDYLHMTNSEKREFFHALDSVGEQEECKKEQRIQRLQGLFRVLNQWLYMKEDNKTFSVYFNQHDIRSIAIYGMGHLGRHLAKELKKENIIVAYGIDQKNKKVSGLQIYDLEYDLRKVDLIIVTPIYEFEDIYERLYVKNIASQIVSLEKLIDEVMRGSENTVSS